MDKRLKGRGGGAPSLAHPSFADLGKQEIPDIGRQAESSSRQLVEGRSGNGDDSRAFGPDHHAGSPNELQVQLGRRDPSSAIVDDEEMILRRASKAERGHFARMQTRFSSNHRVDNIRMHRHPRQCAQIACCQSMGPPDGNLVRDGSGNFDMAKNSWQQVKLPDALQMDERTGVGDHNLRGWQVPPPSIRAYAPGTGGNSSGCRQGIGIRGAIRRAWWPPRLR